MHPFRRQAFDINQALDIHQATALESTPTKRVMVAAKVQAKYCDEADGD